MLCALIEFLHDTLSNTSSGSLAQACLYFLDKILVLIASCISRHIRIFSITLSSKWLIVSKVEPCNFVTQPFCMLLATLTRCHTPLVVDFIKFPSTRKVVILISTFIILLILKFATTKRKKVRNQHSKIPKTYLLLNKFAFFRLLNSRFSY